MAHFGKDLDDFKGSRCILIRSAEQTEHFTLYIITVTVGSYSWTVKHRYSEFYQLHEKLAASYKLDRSLLPPKKLFGNQTESFIKKRQRELEIYLQTIVLYLAQHIPSCLAYFLDFDKYEIHGITQAMAEDLYSRGESLLLSRDKYEVTTLQLYSLTERLKLPEPTCDSGDVKKDLGHILDFITRAKHLKVVCSRKPVDASNILMTKLPFDLTLFKSLQTLEVCGCNFRIANGLETVKQTLYKLEVHGSTSSMKEIFLQDAPHWRAEDGSIIVGYWNLITELDFSCNSFLDIHDSIQLMPNIEKLNLSNNSIESIVNLHWLSQLTHIDLSHNNIHYVDSLHTKLGNIKCMRVSHNELESLHGFAKLFSLKTLDVSYNKIVSIEELRYVSQLPCVEELSLEGNPVTSLLDYRTKTLEMFGERVAEVVLDKKPADQKELDTVAVLQALRRAKDVKVTKRTHPNKNTSAVSLSDMYSQSLSSSLSDRPDGKYYMSASQPNDFARPSIPSSVSHWQKMNSSLNNHSSSSISQGSISSYNSIEEREDEASTYCITISPPMDEAESSSPTDRIEPVHNNISNNSTNIYTNNKDGSTDIVHAFLHEVIPEAHPFDLGIESSSSYSSGMNKLASSVRKNDSGNVTLMFSAADLPTTTNPAFLLWLNKHLFTSGDITTVGDMENSRKGKESIIDVLWCYVEQLSKPSTLFACCAVLTKGKFFIERFTGLESSFPGVPELKPCSMVSIPNIQQLVLGPCHAFLRLEEAFVGKSGVFTLFGIEPQGLKKFFSKLFVACCELQVINSYSFIDLTVKSDLLKMVISREEQSSEMSSDRLVSAALVQLKNSHAFNFLVLSENRVYCLDLDCVHWPPASFETSPEASICFNVHHEFSIMDKISNIKISPSENPELDNGRNRYDWALSDPGLDVQFVQYELSLDVAFSLGNSSGSSSKAAKFSEGISEFSQRHISSISYYFPSAACRDLFLDRLSNMRSELAHRMSPNVREEPEGGNEQLSPNDRHGFKSWSSSSSRPIPSPASTGGVSFTIGHVSPILKTVYKGSTMEASHKALHNSASVIQNSRSPNREYRFDEKDALSESMGSHKSTGSNSISKTDCERLSRPQTLTKSPTCSSSSPKDDISVSPMSNFSRASISPSFSHEPPVKIQINHSQTSKFRQQTSQTKADSLPSSFDWKQYYFKSLPCPVLDTSSNQNLVAGRSGQQDEFINAGSRSISTHFEILKRTHDKFLEDIESSSEFEPGLNVETELEQYLKQCVKSHDLIHPLSTKLKPLCLMNGRELRKFFHSAIAHKLYSDNQDMLSEELHYVLWCTVVPYTNPKHEIITLVMLSTHGIYLVSDTDPKMAHKSRPSWMTHSRNRSDSDITLKSGKSAGNRKLIEPYFMFRYTDLLQVNIGLFDQCVRLTGRNENSVFTIATRDCIITETFVQKLKHVLSFMAISPVIERSRTETDNDFYKASVQNIKSTLDGIVYTHPSKVKFIYPGEDAVRDILYLANERAHNGTGFTAAENTSKLWLYMQSYLLPSDDGRAPDRSQPRSVVITATHFCLTEEDIVTYPLPDFVRGVPENPCHEIVECRRVDSLKRITLFHGNPHNVSLTFLDESPDIVVDVSMQHFGQIKDRHQLCPEVTYRLYVQSVKERDKMVQVLDTLWKGLVTQVGRILDINKV